MRLEVLLSGVMTPILVALIGSWSHRSLKRLHRENSDQHGETAAALATITTGLKTVSDDLKVLDAKVDGLQTTVDHHLGWHSSSPSVRSVR